MTLFHDLKEIFLTLGFKEDQIISMDNITAGDYLVAHVPDQDTPRFLCLLDKKGSLKIECGQINSTNFHAIKHLLEAETIRNNITNYVLIDDLGYILDELSGGDQTPFILDIGNLYQKFVESINELKSETNVFQAEFNFSFPEYKLKEEKTIIETSLFNSVDEDDDTDEIHRKITEFIKSKGNRKSIQSRHVLQLYPDWTKHQALKTLKSLVIKKVLVQKGSWFSLKP